MTPPVRSTDALIKELVRSTGAVDAPAAIRLKARELIELYVASFGNPTMPINVDVLASLRGIARSEELPLHSADAEIVPDGTGGVTMRVNPDRPDTRQRFSVAHEISHTFFPDYTTKRWCRPDARLPRSNRPGRLPGNALRHRRRRASLSATLVLCGCRYRCRCRRAGLPGDDLPRLTRSHDPQICRNKP